MPFSSPMHMDMTFLWDSSVALGTPVVPPVKIIRMSSSGDLLRGFSYGLVPEQLMEPGL